MSTQSHLVPATKYRPHWLCGASICTSSLSPAHFFQKNLEQIHRSRHLAWALALTSLLPASTIPTTQSWQNYGPLHMLFLLHDSFTLSLTS